MTPRGYDMKKRAASAEQTRRRIIEAAFALHSRKGVAATTWQDLADEAGVAAGTVYNHFRSFDDLVPACTGFGMSLFPVPGPEMLDGLRSRKARCEKLVRTLFSSYAGMQGALRFAVVERHTIPIVARTMGEMAAHVDSLVRATLGESASREAIAAGNALVDFRVWDALRERELPEEVICGIVVDSLVRLR
ncbi:MAG TPA: helix-turn-helix domain-containing protein [Actinomycetota bacterium]|nr:helix-turn-helix domain-containing protein [Actinomycetota bacterium]